MKKKLSRLLSFLLVLVLLADGMPATAFAKEAESDVSGNTLEETADEESLTEETVDEESLTEETVAEETVAEESADEEDVSAEVSGNDLPVEGGNASIAAVEHYVHIDDSTFPDESFRAWVKRNADINKDGKLSTFEINNMTQINVSYLSSANYDRIEDLSGIEYFTALKELNCRDNALASLDVSANESLETLDCGGNSLRELKLNANLKSLGCYYNHNTIETLDLSGLSKLEDLRCHYASAEELKLDGCTSLQNLVCIGNGLTSLDLEDCKQLETLKCGENALTTLNVDGCTQLKTIVCNDNMLTTLSMVDLEQLEQLNCNNNRLTELDMSQSSKLKYLYCENNRLVGPKLHEDASLMVLKADGNVYPATVKQKSQFFYINVSDLPESFDITKASSWVGVTVNNNQQTLSITSGAKKATYSYDCGGASVTLTLKLIYPDTALLIDEEHFPDTAFRDYVEQELDTDEDGYLSEEELTAVTAIDLSSNTEIYSLSGIEYFTELQALDCSAHYLTTLDLKQNTALTTLNCSYNKLTELDLSNNTALTTLECQGNKLTALDISQCVKLTTLHCYWNDLTSLNVSNNVDLEELECWDNPLTSLDVSQNTKLSRLDTYFDLDYSYAIELDEKGQFDLSTLPGDFQPEKAGNWGGAMVTGDILTVDEGIGCVSYTYDCGGGFTGYFYLRIPEVDGLWVTIPYGYGEYMYMGTPWEPEVYVFYGDQWLEPGKDYTVSYKNNINAAPADAKDSKGRSIAPTIVVTGKGNYSGTVTKTFSIQPFDLKYYDPEDEWMQEYLSIQPVYAKYTGKVIKGKPVIKCMGKTLSSKEYTLKYEDGDDLYKECGTYTITVVGNGMNFTGKTEVKEYIVDQNHMISKTKITLEKSSVPYDSMDEKTGLVYPGKITVKSGSVTLKEGVDYTVDYQDADEAGTAKVIITGKETAGWYGTQIKTYKITGKKLTASMVKQYTKTYTYDKQSHYPTLGTDYAIFDGTYELKNGKDFKRQVISGNWYEPGTFKIAIQGIGAYTGSVTLSFTIQKASVEDEDVTIQLTNINQVPYSKGGAKPKPVVTFHGEQLVEGVDYTITYKNNTKPGYAGEQKAPYFYITGKGKFFTGSTKANPKKFTIQKASLADNVTVFATDFAYKDKNGNYIPSLTVTDNANGKKLANKTDYQIDHYEIYNPATGMYEEFQDTRVTLSMKDTDGRIKMRVAVVGTEKGYYSGTGWGYYEIYTSSITSAKVDPIPTQEYTGSALCPKLTVSVKVKEGNTNKTVTLTEGTDYTVEYFNNRSKGTATVYIYGQGQYGGVKKVTFKITEKKLQWWKALFT